MMIFIKPNFTSPGIHISEIMHSSNNITVIVKKPNERKQIFPALFFPAAISICGLGGTMPSGCTGA